METEELQHGRAGRKKKRKKKKKGKIILIVILIIIVIAGVLIAAAMSVIKDKLNKIEKVDLDRENLGINSEVADQLKDYKNIALLGIDTRDVTNDKGSRSDAIIIASINEKTNDVKLTSVFRDCYLYLDDNREFDKVTHAYAFGGLSKTLTVLNKNLDLNIDDAVVVNWKSVADTVDALGGLDIEVKSNELGEMNKYVHDTVKTIGGKAKEIDKAGVHHLDGVQAVTYARIRKGESGGDSARAERMRKLINAAFEKAKQQSIGELNTIADNALPTIKTSLSTDNLMSMLLKINSYSLTKSSGFPYNYDGWYHYGVWYDVPITLKSNVIEMHKKAFGQKNYTPSKRVKDYNDQIVDKTGYYGD